MRDHACIEPTLLHQEYMKAIIKKHECKMQCMQTTLHRWGERTWQIKGAAQQLEPYGTWPKQGSTQRTRKCIAMHVGFCSNIMHACFVLLSRPHAWCKGRVEFTRYQIVSCAFSTSVCTCAVCPFSATWIYMQLYVDAWASPPAHTHTCHTGSGQSAWLTMSTPIQTYHACMRAWLDCMHDWK